MSKVFFTYVWGSPGNPAWPLTFSSKSARSHAKRVLQEGDIVFTVCTKHEPTPEEFRGKVVGMYLLSDLEVNAVDYDIPQERRSAVTHTIQQFPYALHPIAVFRVTDKNNFFSDVVGKLSGRSYLQAQSKIVEVGPAAAASLLALKREEVAPAMPKSELGLGQALKKLRKLAPKHQGTFSGQFGDHELWYVYCLTLRDRTGKSCAVKVGYALDPEARRNSYNMSVAAEVTGFLWHLEFKQPVSKEDAARAIEQDVLAMNEINRLDSNGEIIRGVDPLMIGAAIGKLTRAKTA